MSSTAGPAPYRRRHVLGPAPGEPVGIGEPGLVQLGVVGEQVAGTVVVMPSSATRARAVLRGRRPRRCSQATPGRGGEPDRQRSRPRGASRPRRRPPRRRVHGPADGGVADGGGDPGDQVEDAEVGAGQLRPAEGGDQLHDERLRDHHARGRAAGRRPARAGRAARRPAAPSGARPCRRPAAAVRTQPHQRQARGDPPRPAPALLERTGDAQLQGRWRPSRRGRRVRRRPPSRWPAGRRRAAAGRAGSAGRTCRPGPGERQEGAVAEALAPVAERRCPWRVARPGRAARRPARRSAAAKIPAAVSADARKSTAAARCRAAARSARRSVAKTLNRANASALRSPASSAM